MSLAIGVEFNEYVCPSFRNFTEISWLVEEPLTVSSKMRKHFSFFNAAVCRSKFWSAGELLLMSKLDN